MILEFINLYGYDLLYAIVVAIGGFIGLCLKELFTKIAHDKTKLSVAKNAVKYVEQVFRDLHGDEKLNKAMEAASQMLAEKGIAITDLELRVLIEAALAELNNVFEKAE